MGAEPKACLSYKSSALELSVLTLHGMDTPFTKRLKLAIEQHPTIKLAADLARAAKVTEATVSNWLNNKIQEDQGKALVGIKLSRALGIRVEWLFTGEEPMRPGAEAQAAIAHHETREGYVRFQLMDAAGGAGPGMINSDYPEVLREVEIAEWQLRQELGRVPSPSRVKLLTVRGESMAPRIRSGDVVFVDMQDQQPCDGGLFVIVLHGHAMVKRLEIRTDGLHIVSLATPDRPDILPPNKMESLHIAGRVLGAIQLRRPEDL